MILSIGGRVALHGFCRAYRDHMLQVQFGLLDVVSIRRFAVTQPPEFFR
jgi:hypothetical protein